MLNNPLVADTALSDETRDFYIAALAALQKARIPFLVGGAYALAHYTGVERHTKDLDIFARPRDAKRILDCLAAQGYRTEMTFPHWLGKAYGGGDFIDVIFSSGNGIARVDDAWFAHAVGGEVFGVPVKLAPAEEILWSKGFIQERERYDGADIAHLLRARAAHLDWKRLLARYGEDWRVLLAHLTLFSFIYPAERDAIPRWVLRRLLGRQQEEMRLPAPPAKTCNGTLLSRQQYLVDVARWGYEDARLSRGDMTPEQVAHWTAGIARDGHEPRR